MSALEASVMTTFARACPSSKYRMASWASPSGYVLSMTGVTLPQKERCERPPTPETR